MPGANPASAAASVGPEPPRGAAPAPGTRRAPQPEEGHRVDKPREKQTALAVVSLLLTVACLAAGLYCLAQVTGAG